MARSAALLALVAVAAAAAPAHAIVLSEDELEETSVEVGVVARSFSFVLMGEPLEPPLALEDINPTGAGLLDLRLYAQKQTASLKLVLHAGLLTQVSSADIDAGVPLGRGLPPARWFPLSYDFVDDPTIRIGTFADWAYVAYSRGSVTTTVGRQPVTFGRGKVWRPTDLVSTFALTEVDTEYKPGADGVRVDWSPGPTSSMTAVATTGELSDDVDLGLSVRGTTALARYKRSWDRGELGGLAGYVRGDAVVAVDGIIDLEGREVYAEAVLTIPSSKSLSSPEAGPGDLVPKAILGATFRPTTDLTLSPELLYDGFGAANADGYLAVANSERVAIGEQITLGRLYAAGIADWEMHPLVHLGGFALLNALDPSGLVSAAIRYDVADNAEAVLGGYVAIGETPESLLDVVDEYGLFPSFLFFELKAVL